MGSPPGARGGLACWERPGERTSRRQGVLPPSLPSPLGSGLALWAPGSQRRSDPGSPQQVARHALPPTPGDTGGFPGPATEWATDRTPRTGKQAAGNTGTPCHQSRRGHLRGYRPWRKPPGRQTAMKTGPWPSSRGHLRETRPPTRDASSRAPVTVIFTDDA